MKEDLESIKELERIDPFDIPLDKYRSLTNNEKTRSLAYRIIMERLYELYAEWIENEFRKRRNEPARSLLVCDRKVIFSSKDEYGPSGKYIAEIEEKMGKPCYLLSEEPLIEEKVSWQDLGGGDYYPTIEIYLVNKNWHNQKVFKDGVKIRSDFDTGNSKYAVFNEDGCKMVGDKPEKVGFRRHLGRPYFYYLRSMKIGIKNEKVGRCLEKLVEGIDNWDDIRLNPYKIANPNRKGFVGRDLMLKLFVRIVLDPKAKESTWELL